MLDFSKVQFIDSSAIGWLIQSAREFKARGGGLVVHSIVPRVRQMFDMLKIGFIVPLVIDEAAAREQFLAPVAPARTPNGSPVAGGMEGPRAVVEGASGGNSQ